MKIKYLGTAAYEGIPSLFCQCETCKKSLALGGKNLRSRSQALINDELLIDFPPDTVWHFQKYKIDFTKINNCLITHSHSDHFYLDDMAIIRNDYCHTTDYQIAYYSGEKVYSDVYKLKNESGNLFENMSINKLEPYKYYLIKDYNVLALPADHDPSSSPLIYAIEYKNKKMLYANDTGYFKDEVINALKDFGKLDLISLDCTGALEKGWTSCHMSFDTNLRLLEKLKENQIIDDKTIIVVHHFSHNGKATYDELNNIARSKNIIVSYDGLEIEF